jgi:sugar/nucleoside kinase (ribokinase family)
VLVVIGIPVRRPSGQAVGVAGTPALAAVAAARAGATVELVGKAGDDPAGDALVLALGQLGVGHAALLRDAGRATPVADDPPADDGSLIPPETADGSARGASVNDRTGWPSLEPEDLQLALRYLSDVRAIVVAEPLAPRVLTAVTEAASYLGAPVVIVADDPSDVPVADLVLAPPTDDADGAFAEVLGQVGAALDRGVGVDDAFREVTGRLGLTSAST